MRMEPLPNEREPCWFTHSRDQHYTATLFSSMDTWSSLVAIWITLAILESLTSLTHKLCWRSWFWNNYRWVYSNRTSRGEDRHSICHWCIPLQHCKKVACSNSLRLRICKELAKSRDPHNRPIVYQRTTSSSPKVDQGLSKSNLATQQKSLTFSRTPALAFP